MDNNAKATPESEQWSYDQNFLKNRKWQMIIFVLIFALIFVFIMYKSGYRINSNFTVGKVGTVVIKVPMPLTYIFIDQSKKITTSEDNETVSLTFSPRAHSIIISRDGYFPWKKDFLVTSGDTLELKPIFVSQNATGEIITVNDPEYYKIRNTVIKNSSPSKNSPKISKDGSITLWLEESTINTSVGSTTKVVIEPDTIVKNVDFYKDRSDALLFSTGNSVYVIEVDSLGGQNFMPVYRGQNPNFVTKDANSIYVLDGETLMQVII